MGDARIGDLAAAVTALWLAAGAAIALIQPFGRRTPFSDAAALMGGLLAAYSVAPVLRSFTMGAP